MTRDEQSQGVAGAPPSQGGETQRKRAYAPRVSKKDKAKDARIELKQAELRDAKILGRLTKEAELLTPWGLGEFKAAIAKMGPVQEGLFDGRTGDGYPPREEAQSGETLPKRPEHPSKSATLSVKPLPTSAA